MKSRIKVTPTIVIGWLTAIGAFVVGVAPILPASAPEWLHVWLPFAGLVIALLTQSVRKLEPTTSEAGQALTSPEARASMPPAGPQ